MRRQPLHSSPTTDDIRQRRPAVLVVEDNPELRALYRNALTWFGGYKVITVEDGVGALREVDNASPDIVVLDLGLPRLNGFDFRRELNAHPETHDVPVVVVTGADTHFDESEFTCVLRKPIDVATLVAAVENCLQKAKPPATTRRIARRSLSFLVGLCA